MHDDTAGTTEKNQSEISVGGGAGVDIPGVWMPQTDAASRNKTGGENNKTARRFERWSQQTDSRLGETLTNQGLIQ